MLNKIKELLNKKVNYAHFIGLGIILFICGFLIYFKSQEIDYMYLSTLGILVTTAAGLIHYIKNNKQQLKIVVFGSVLIVFVFSSMAMFAKQMNKSTNISIEAWLNSISVMGASLIGAGISGFISFLLVSRQIKISNEIIEKQIDENKRLTTYALEASKEETDMRNNNVALNYILLLNTEMAMHRQMYVIYLYYKFHSNPIAKDLTDIFKSLNNEKWDKLFVECAKCLSSELMQELTGYYCGVEAYRLMEMELNDIQKEEVLKGQLFSMYSCINIIESEFNTKLRKQEVYDIEGEKVSVDKMSGELIIK